MIPFGCFKFADSWQVTLQPLTAGQRAVSGATAISGNGDVETEVDVPFLVRNGHVQLMHNSSPQHSPAESDFPPTPSDEHVDPASLSSSSASLQPLSSSNALIEVMHDDKIDWEEEEQFYRQFTLVCLSSIKPYQNKLIAFQDNESSNFTRRRSFTPPAKLQRPPSIFSNDIWFEDNTAQSPTVAQSVSITGWTSVGDKLGGAYIGQFAQ